MSLSLYIYICTKKKKCPTQHIFIKWPKPCFSDTKQRKVTCRILLTISNHELIKSSKVSINPLPLFSDKNVRKYLRTFIYLIYTDNQQQIVCGIILLIQKKNLKHESESLVEYIQWYKIELLTDKLT